jgi:exonuclease III
MRIVSWNVRGLGGGQWKRKQGRVRQEMQKHVIGQHVDILLLQEHRLSKEKTKKYGSTMYEDWDHFWGNGYGAQENARGVCIVSNGKWRKNILHLEVIE